MASTRSQIAGCVAALVLTGAGFLGRAALVGAEADSLLLVVPYLPAVLISVWLGGLWPGLLATALGLLGMGYTVQTETPGGVLERVNMTRLLLFAAGGTVLSFFAERFHQWYAREERLLREAESARRWLDGVVAGIPEPFFTVDADWRITAVSERFAALRGVARSDLAGDLLWERFPDLKGTELELHLRKVAGQRSGAAFEARDERTGRWFACCIYPSGAGVAVLMTDVTDTRRAVDALRHGQELLQRLIDAIPVMITTYDPASRLLRVNREFERLTGFSAGDAAGQPLIDANYPDPACRQTVREFMESGAEGWMDVRMRTRDGHEIEASWAYIRLSDETLVGIGIDLTSRRRSEERLAWLGAIVESSDDAIVSKTPDGLITSWNSGAERLYGYTAAEAIGRPITIIIPPDRRGEEQRIVDALGRGERVDHVETVRVAKDGRLIDVSLTVSAIRDSSGRIVGASKVARDISARKRAEREMREADRRKNEFLATLAHELRNPLAPIRSSLELLRLTGGGSETVRQVHDMLDRQVRHMVRLVDDLLDVSRITHGRIELQRQRLDFLDAVRGALDVTRPIIESRHQHLSVSTPDGPLPVDGDLVRLTQVVINLLQNATKFTHEGGEISVDVGRSDGEVVLRVRDNGRGIDPEFLPEVFSLFAQGDRPPEHETAGLGVGLTLVHRLVEQHGGRVEARSEGPGRGSEFTVRLPASDRPAVLPAASPASPRAGQLRLPGPVLVVDDNRDAAESMALLLRYLGADVVVAHDGTDALAALSEHQPAVVLLDIGLPGMDGYQVAELIRAHPLLRNTRLVALTGWGHEEARRRAKESGFEHHLVKPVDVEVLRTLLTEIGEGLSPKA